MRPKHHILGIFSQYLKKYETLTYIVGLVRCKILCNIAGMENFTIEHINLGIIFLEKN